MMISGKGRVRLRRLIVQGFEITGNRDMLFKSMLEETLVAVPAKMESSPSASCGDVEWEMEGQVVTSNSTGVWSYCQ